MAIKKRTTSKQKAASRRNLEKARAAKKRAGKVQIGAMKAAGKSLGRAQRTINAYFKSGWIPSDPRIARRRIKERNKASTAKKNALKKIRSLASRYSYK